MNLELHTLKKRFFFNYYTNISAVMLIPVLLLGTLTFLFINNNIKREITRNSETLFGQTAQFSSLLFQTFDSVNLMISSDINLLNALSRVTKNGADFSADDLSKINSLYSTLLSLIASGTYIQSVSIHLRGANRYFSSDGKINAYDSTNSRDIRASAEKQNGIDLRAQLHTAAGGENKQTATISIYRGLLNGSGIVEVAISRERLRQSMTPYVQYPEQSIYISDGERFVCLTDTEAAVPQQNLQLFRKIAEQNIPVTRIAEYNGKKYRIAGSPLEQYGWLFLAVTPEAELYKLQYTLTAVIAGVVGFCLCVGVLIALRTASKNCRSIQQILDAIDAAEQGKSVVLQPEQHSIYAYIVNTIIQNGILQDYMRVQISERKYLAQILELKALQYQINPHFLVNTLKTIYWQEVSAKGFESPSSTMVENLLDVTGYILSDFSERVTLGEEIRHTKSFTDILTARHKNELSVIWKYPPEALDAETCRLVLQPFIENAFYHGVRGARKGRFGKIFIKILVSPDPNGIPAVTIKIADNGCGLDKARLEAIRASLRSEDLPNAHIGMYNPHRRIRLAYGNEYGIEVNSKTGIGTCVTIRFPYRKTAGAS